MVRHPILPALLFLLAAAQAHGADPDRGKTIVMQGNGKGALACMTCHGLDGAGNAGAGFPRLAGLNPSYLAKQIADYKNGSRTNPVMKPFAMALTDEEAADVAAYYAAQQAPAAPPAADPSVLKQGERLALNGDWDKNVPACESCHGPGGRGVGAGFPALAGQHSGYITAQFRDWRTGARTNDPIGLMKAVADRLSAEQAAAAAAYFAGLQPAK